MMEIVVTDITTQVEIEAGQELFEVVVTVADSESAERFAIEARESAAEADISAGIATVKALGAVASASNALNSENEAENAATTATEQAIISAAARDESVSAKLAAQDSEDNALTYSTNSATSASNALASENAAELAASQIVDKIDFTGSASGDLYQVNALGVAVPVKLQDLLKNYAGFTKSPLSVSFPQGSKAPILWGHPSAPYSGQVPLAGFDSLQYVFPCTINGGGAYNLSMKILGQYYGNSTFNFRIGIGIDSNNYLLIKISRSSVEISAKIAGVFTVVQTNTYSTGFATATQAFDEIDISFGRVSESTLLVSKWIPRMFFRAPINAANDFNFIAFGSDEFSGSRGIENVVIYGDRIVTI
jgi:hypothetical protein